MVRQPDYSNDLYDPLDIVTLEARPSPGYVFDNWSGSVDGIADPRQRVVSFQMSHDRTITANFALSDVYYSVTAIIEPSGGGSVGFQPDQPPGGYRVNESVSVLAVAQTGYVFSRWAGDLAGTQNPRTMLVSEDKSISAIFNPTVTIYCSPSEGGSVALEPAQSINGYAVGTEVTINAEANKGYRFVSWEGDVSDSRSSTTVTVNEPKTITARFAGDSPSRWWLWVILGLVGLVAAIVLVRLVALRMNRGTVDEPPEPDE